MVDRRQRRVRTDVLDMAAIESGPADGAPVVLLHGFPYDVRAYDGVAERLAAAGCRVIVPWLRGYGPTRFLRADTPRSGEQAALAKDLRDLIDALGLTRPVLAGYDWGGRAACIVAALWPERVGALVSGGGYNIFAAPDPAAIAPPWLEHLLWYQHVFNRPGAHARFAAQRDAFCHYLWQIWSPDWAFDEATFQATAASFDNPDFVEVVIHSYRHRAGNAAGDPALAAIARAAEARPPIAVPVTVLQGSSGVTPPALSESRAGFSGPWERILLPGIGHNIPQEAPDAFAAAVLRSIQPDRGTA